MENMSRRLSLEPINENTTFINSLKKLLLLNCISATKYNKRHTSTFKVISMHLCHFKQINMGSSKYQIKTMRHSNFDINCLIGIEQERMVNTAA